MTPRVHLCPSLLAVAAILALAGCKAPTGAGNDQAANEVSVANDMGDAALAPDSLPLPAGDSAVVEDGDTAPPIQVASVPAPAPAIAAADAAPLSDAVAAERLIAAGRGIKRVQQADGWAWMQDGQIIRTASADGRRVSYFRHGTTAPYLVQQDGRSYSYANGRLSREYDDHGRPQAPDAQHRNEAQRFADEARRQHDRAQRASQTAKPIDRSHDHGNDGHHGTGRVTPQPTPTSTPGRDGGHDHDGHATPGNDQHAGDSDHGSSRHGSNSGRDGAGRHDRDARDDSQSNQMSPRR
jgi:hypothetical protein